MTNRLYSFEGAAHFYSSLPTCIYPADLYNFQNNEMLKQYLINCNIYLVARRKRITIDPALDKWNYKNGIFYGNFIVPKNYEKIYVPFSLEITPELAGTSAPIKYLDVDKNGLAICVISEHLAIASQMHKIISKAESQLEDEDKDLEILYIGQALGKSNNRSAIDRLLNHSKLQRILAETVTYDPRYEVLLLLYNFEHSRIISSSGGDLTLTPQANDTEDFAHLENIQNVRFSRKEKIALIEAALINYFKPFYNDLLKNTSFAAKRKIETLKPIIKKNLTGLIVEICSVNLKSRLWTKNAPPIDLTDSCLYKLLTGENLDTEELKQRGREEFLQHAHTHNVQIPLTTSEERNTFLHGIKWQS